VREIKGKKQHSSSYLLVLIQIWMLAGIYASIVAFPRTPVEPTGTPTTISVHFLVLHMAPGVTGIHKTKLSKITYF
jgi:hypothetical protein